MADSDNSMTLPLVTRRSVVAGTAIAMGTWGSSALASNYAEADLSSDPVVALWHRWQDARRLTEQLCRQQQGLERRLADTVGFPCARFQLSNGQRVTLHSLREIHGVLYLHPMDAAILARAEADFTAHQLRWDRADQEIGYSAAVEAERDAAGRAQDLLEALAATPATSLAGVAAKLDAVLREGEYWEDGTEFPCPQIRSALDDLARLGPQLQPGWSLPREEHQPKPHQGGGLQVWNTADGGAA